MQNRPPLIHTRVLNISATYLCPILTSCAYCLVSSPLADEFRSRSLGCPCYYISVLAVSVPWRSISRLSPRGDSRKKRNHGRTQPPADPSSVTRAIFTHARTGGTKRSNRGTVPWLTFEPFTFSRTLTYIYIYIFPRETVEYFRSNRLLLYPVTTILSMEIFRSWPTEKYNKDIVFSSCEFACKMHERR